MIRSFTALILIGTSTIFGAAHASAQDAPARPKPPAIKSRDWIQIPLDAFVLHRLEAAGMKPRPEVPREEAIKRLTFAIAGRDATSAEVAAFVASRDKRVYEKEIERLLAVPGFGERFADVETLIEKDDPRSARAAAKLAWRRLVGQPLADDALEWLACELLDPTLINCCELERPLPEAWDVKHLVRAIVVSATYRQGP